MNNFNDISNIKIAGDRVEHMSKLHSGDFSAYMDTVTLADKARTLEEVSGLSIDALISYYMELRRFAEQHAAVFARVNVILPGEIEKLLIKESEVEPNEPELQNYCSRF